MFYLTLQKQSFFNRVCVYIQTYKEPGNLYCKEFVNQISLTQYPLYGKSLLNTTEILVKYNNFDKKYKDLEFSIPELKLYGNLEIFKKTIESMTNFSPLSENGKEFEYLYEDSNKLVTGSIDVNGKKYDLLGSNAIVQWYRANGPWKAYVLSGFGLGSIKGVQFSLSTGIYLQSEYSKSTPDCAYYGKNVIKLGQSKFLYKNLASPIEITTKSFNSTVLSAVFFAEPFFESYTNYYIGKAKNVFVPGRFIGNITSLLVNTTFELRGLVHIRLSSLII